MKISRLWDIRRSLAVSSSRWRAVAASAGAWTGSTCPRRPRGTHFFLLNFRLYNTGRRFSVPSPVIHHEMSLLISFVESKSRSYQRRAWKLIQTTFTKLPCILPVRWLYAEEICPSFSGKQFSSAFFKDSMYRFLKLGDWDYREMK